MARISGALVGSLLFVASLIAQEEQMARPPLEPDGECGTIDLRTEDWLRRHGDHGRVDPLRMRNLVREQYEASLRDRSIAAIAPSGIAGSTWAGIGPTNVAGRVVSIAPHPSIAGLVYVGTATGGVWMTNNSGATWTSLTDGLADLSVGAIAIAPSSPSTIYLGTGEPVGSGIPGIGFLSSGNGGGTWNFPGTGVLATSFWKLSVHPTNALDVLAGTSSGGFRSLDGGGNWTPWVVPAANSGQQITDIIRDPTNANTLYASTYYGGVSPTVLKSTDGGSHWTAFGSGLPSDFNMRRIMLASDSTGSILYAAFDLSSIAYVYKSTSGGAWANTAPVDPAGLYYNQGGYNNAVVVAPGGSTTVIVCGGICSKSTTGGSSWAYLSPTGAGYHVDIHDLRFDAGGTLYMGTDGGIFTSSDTGGSTVNRQAGMVTTQFYGIANDPSNSTRVFGGLQDNGSLRKDGSSTDWTFVTGSDGGQAAVDRENPSVVWTTNQVWGLGNHLWRTKEAGAADPLFIQLAPTYETSESGTFPFPMIIRNDPQHPSTVYTSSQRLWKSITAGDAWTPLPTTTTDGSTWNSWPIYAIAIAKSNPSVLMVAKSTMIFRTTDGGSTWQQANGSLPGYGINDIEIDPRNPDVAYAALATTSGSSLYATANGGSTWTVHSSGLPNFAAETVRVDPTDSTTLYCGTDVGVYRSTNSGSTWSLFGTGMPRVAVYDLRIADDGSVLRAGTFGRGVWELQIPASANHPPSVAITSPVSQTVGRYTTLTFTGTIDDIDEDSFAATWSFPDTWERAQKTTIGTFSVSHTFLRPGIWPVTLASQDEHGAVSAQTVVITVTDFGDACASPVVIPNVLTGPTTVLANSESWVGFDGTDPSTSCYPYTTYYSGWFVYTPTSSGNFTFSTCGSTFDTLLSAYTGACGSLTEIGGGCNNDIDANGTNGCNGGGSSIMVALTAGQTVHLRVASPYYFDTRGAIALTMSPASSTAPTVTRIATTAGPSTGGTPVTIYGSNFASGPTVMIGGVVATSVNVATPHIINAVTPAHNPGEVDVTVMNTNGQSGRLMSAFTFSDCSFSLSGSSTNIGASAGAGAVFVTASAGCAWSAWSSASWLTTTSAGIGNGTLSYTWQPNLLVTPRTATISLANQTFTVAQSGVLPYNLTATASSTTSISINWFSSSADHFEVWRNDGSGWVLAGTSTVMSFPDTVTANHEYVYRVRAVDGNGGQSAYTTPDTAAAIAFTDNPLVAGSTVIRAVHLAELRQAVDAVRGAAVIGAFGWTDSAAAGVPIRLVHLTEVRSALDAARAALGMSPLTWSPVPPGSTVMASQFTELRNALK